MRINARPRLDPLDDAALPAEARAHFDATGPAMRARGFERVAQFRVSGHVPNVTALVALWVNRPAGQSAGAVTFYSKVGAEPPRVKSYVEFSTRLAGELTVLTNNTPELGAFKPRADTDILSAVAVQDPTRLHDLHLAREARLVEPDALRYLAAPPHELDAFAEAFAWNVASQAETGWLERDEAPNIYRPTWIGAFAMVYGQLPPWKGRRLTEMARRAAHELAVAAARPPYEAPTVPVPVTHASPYRA